MIAVGNVDKLRGHAQSGCRFAHAAFEDCVYLQLASDLADVFALSLEGKRGGPRRHSKRFDLRQRVNDLLSNAIAEKLILRIIAHIDEGKDGNALLRHAWRSFRFCCRDRLGCWRGTMRQRSEEHTSELQSHSDLVCRLLLEKKKKE